MSKLTIRKLKWELQQKIKILPAGKRHKDWDYPVFIDLSKDLKITAQTPLENNEVQTAVCFAGDLRKNLFGYYILLSVDESKNIVHCTSLENKGQNRSFYADAVSLIPEELIPSVLKLKLLKHEDIIKLDKQQKQRRKVMNDQPNA